MSIFSRHIGNLVQMDLQTVAAPAPIGTVATCFIKDCLAQPPLVLLVYPFLLAFSRLAQYFFLQAELFTPKKLDQRLTWGLGASLCGPLMGRGIAGRDCRCAIAPATTGRERLVPMRVTPRCPRQASACFALQSG
jgi:hypothetical protein